VKIRSPAYPAGLLILEDSKKFFVAGTVSCIGCCPRPSVPSTQYSVLQTKTAGLRPRTAPYSFCLPKKSKQKKGTPLLARLRRVPSAPRPAGGRKRTRFARTDFPPFCPPVAPLRRRHKGKTRHWTVVFGFPNLDPCTSGLGPRASGLGPRASGLSTRHSSPPHPSVSNL